MPNTFETQRQIDLLAKLPNGWHYGKGIVPSSVKARIMRNILVQARHLGFEVFEAFPGVEGEIQLAIYEGPNFYTITIEPNAEFTIIQEKNGAEVLFQEHATFHDVIAKLEDFSFKLWNTSELSTLSNSRLSVGNPAISHSKDRLTVPESRASRRNVRLTSTNQSVGTSPLTTQSLLAGLRLSIGTSLPVPR